MKYDSKKCNNLNFKLASGNAGCSLDDGVYYSYLAVPVILY